MSTLSSQHPARGLSSIASFEQLASLHRDRLFAYARRLSGNREDAEDLVQQSLLEAYIAFERFRESTRFDQWLFQIMRHNFLDLVRRRSRLAVQSLDTPWEEAGPHQKPREVSDPHGNPESELLKELLSEPLQQALERLPGDFRRVLLLIDLQGLTYEEVSSRIGCPIGTVRSRLHRARALMRR